MGYTPPVSSRAGPLQGAALFSAISLLEPARCFASARARLCFCLCLHLGDRLTHDAPIAQLVRRILHRLDASLCMIEGALKLDWSGLNGEVQDRAPVLPVRGVFGRWEQGRRMPE